MNNMRQVKSWSLRGAIAGACLATGFACVAILPSEAGARDFFGYSGGYYPRSYFNYSRSPSAYDYDSGGPRVDRLKAQTAEKLKKAPVPPPTKGPLLVVVSLSKQQLTVYDEGVPFLHSKISSGSRGHETPTGVFAVIQKSRWHRSNLYSDAPMPFMQRITWSGVALHAGQLPGYPASHGCVRLPEDFAIRMWRTTQMGARVIIVQDNAAPAEVAHPLLFVKKDTPAVAPSAPMAALRSTMNAARAALVPPVAAVENSASADAAQVKVADVSIMRAGQVIGGTPVTSDRATQTAASLADTKDAEAKTATAYAGEKPIAREAPVMAAPQPSQPSVLAQAPALAPPTPSPAMPSVAQDRTLRAGPVSVFISRKERKLFVRKGFAPVFEAQVTIKDAEQPLGTHVFTALTQEANSDAFRWNVVTVPNGRADRRAEQPVHLAARKTKKGEPETITDATPLPPPSTDAAKAALDRIEMPADAVQRVSELMTAGASLIITDEGLGPETGQETDFVVLTKDGTQPPAATKKPKRSRYYDWD